MIRVVAVKFKTGGKSYYFDPLDFELTRGTNVIVETTHGLEYAQASFAPIEVTDDKVVLPLKPILRIATPEDALQNEENHKKEKEASVICKEKIEKYGLEMKLVDTEYTFDRNKLLFYFTADGRIDFRELVKELASVFRTRIELRQIGVRDETKIKGGIGICGRELCCQTYLSDFAPVSIRMAKDQNLSLNPTKISGCCGRLMCCLNNEQETYVYLNKQLPKRGATVTTIDGLVGKVQSASTLKQTVKVLVGDEDNRELKDYSVEEITLGVDQQRLDQIALEEERAAAEKEAAAKEAANRKAQNTRQRADQKDRKERKERRDRKDGRGQNDKRREPKEPRADKPDKDERKNHKGGKPQGSKPHYRKRKPSKQEGNQKQNGNGAERKREN